MHSPDYSQYTIQDFLADDSFVRWVVEADETSRAHWNAVQVQHPGQQESIRQAIAILRSYRQQEMFTNETRQQAVWQRIEASVRPEQRLQPKVVRLPMFMRVAAVLVPMLVLGIVIWQFFNRPHTITTGYGEVRTITLPDQSVVTLNGNSSMTYANDWADDSPREVWMEGEAYFEVKHLNRDPAHIAPSDRFIVHSQEINIEVLGTSFNVKNRRNKVNISLISGKIRVHHMSQAATQASQGLVMRPGEYVAYAKERLVEKKILAKPRQLTSWTQNELSFNNPSLRDIVETLQDEKGYSVNLKDESLMKMKIEGEITVANVQELLSTVATTLDLKIELTDKTITISRR